MNLQPVRDTVSRLFGGGGSAVLDREETTARTLNRRALLTTTPAATSISSLNRTTTIPAPGEPTALETVWQRDREAAEAATRAKITPVEPTITTEMREQIALVMWKDDQRELKDLDVPASQRQQIAVLPTDDPLIDGVLCALRITDPGMTINIDAVTFEAAHSALHKQTPRSLRQLGYDPTLFNEHDTYCEEAAVWDMVAQVVDATGGRAVRAF